LIPYPRDVLSGWARPRTPRRAGSQPQPTNHRKYHDILSDQARVDMESTI